MGTEEEQMNFAIKLASVFNLILAGKMSLRVHDLWTDTRVVLLEKPGTPVTYRPIGIGEVIYRILARTAQTSIGKRVGAKLQPHQLAIGTSGGVEIAAVVTDLGTTRAHHHPIVLNGFATLGIDVVNAFNSTRRLHIYNGLQEHEPALLPFFGWAYGRSISMRWSNGTQVAEVATGCTQGDPLSSLYFGVAIQSILQQMAVILREEEEALWRIEQQLTLDDIPSPEQALHLVSTRGSVIAIADDISISGRTAAIFRTAERVHGLLHQLGLHVNMTKSWIMGTHVHTVPNPPEGFTLKADGGKALGRPLGSLDSQREWIHNRLESRGPPRQALGHLPIRSRLHLLRLVYNTRFDYLMKTTSFRLGEEVFKEHDERVDDILSDMGVSYSREELRVLRSLPIHLGGLGIYTLTGPEAKRHRRITAQRTFEFLKGNHPTLLVVLRDNYVNINDLEEREPLAPIAEDNDEPTDNSLTAIINSSKAEVLQAQTDRMTTLLNSLQQDPLRHGHAARLLSAACKGTGKWFASPGWSCRFGPQMSNTEFHHALRCRMLSPFEPIHGRPSVPCTCVRSRNINDHFDLALDPTHPATCSLNKGITTSRHNALRDLLSRFLKRLHPTAVILVEPQDQEHTPRVRRPDLRAEINGVTYAIDIAIVDPCSARARAHPTLSSLTKPDGASLQAEARKRHEHQDTPHAPHLLPFVIESTGRFGPSAKAFLDNLSSHAPAIRSAFLLDTSLLLARTMGRLNADSWARLKDVGA